MSKYVRLIELSSALLATTAIAFPAWAQESAQGAGADSDVIVVTAQRREERLQDVPISINALGQAKLEQANAKALDDYAKLLPSVSIQSFGPSQAQVFFRGVATGSGGPPLHIGPLPTSSTYVDEIPVTTIGGMVDVHLYDISRIEALAGPQGTLFGASSLSGTLRIITNRPELGKTTGSIDLQVNKFGKGDFGGSAEGYINLPVSDNAALRVVGFYDRTGGYIDNIPGTRTFTLDDNDPATEKTVSNTDKPGLVKNDYNDVETYGGRAALRVDLDDNWTVTPQFLYQSQIAHGGFFYDPRKGYLKVTDYLPSRNKDRWWQAALTIQGKLSDWDVTYSGGYFERKVDNIADYSYYSVAYDNYTYVDDNGVTQFGKATYFPDGKGGFLDPTQTAHQNDKYTKFTQELRVNSPTDMPFRLATGMFMQVQTDKIRADYQTVGISQIPTPIWLTPFPNSDTVFLTRVKRKDRDYAMFAQGEYDILPHVTLIAGVRGYIADNTIYGFSGTNSAGNTDPAFCLPTNIPDVPCANVHKKQVENGVIWRGGIKWQVNPDVMLYGTVSRGYRPGGNNRRPGVNPFKSDKLDNFELGWKTHFGRIYFNGAAFYQKWRDLQFGLVPVGQNGVTNTYNAGNARIYGVEGDLSARWGGLTLSTSATYVDAQLTSDFCQVDPVTKNIICVPGTPPAAAKGTRLPIMPRFKGSATARYEWPLGSMTAFVQGSVSHQGGTRTFLTDADYAAVGPTRPFTTADFSIGTHWDHMRIEAFIQNAFSSHGALGKNTICATEICGFSARTYPTKPQFFGLKFGYDFD